MELILSLVFGRKIDVQKGESSILTEAAATVLGATKENGNRNIEYLKMLTSNIFFTFTNS